MIMPLKSLLKTIALITLVAVSHTAAPNTASADDAYMQLHAVKYNRAIERAFGLVSYSIMQDSEGPSNWAPGDIPPASLRWIDAWTDFGMRARYCDGILAVYLAEDAKGTGPNHKMVQVGSNQFSPPDAQGLHLPVLSWMEGSVISGSRSSITQLPQCMTTDYTNPLPFGRAVRVGSLNDPWLTTHDFSIFEAKEVACPVGQYGSGITYNRSKNQIKNGHMKDIGDPVYGPWEERFNFCTADNTVVKKFLTDCSWYQGSPQNETMHGSNFWEHNVTTTAAGITATKPVLYASTCWNIANEGVEAKLPDPTVNSSKLAENRNVACGSGFTGSGRRQRRYKTTEITTFPWAQEPITNVSYSKWSQVSTDCNLVVVRHRHRNCVGENDCNSNGSGGTDTRTDRGDRGNNSSSGPSRGGRF